MELPPPVRFPKDLPSGEMRSGMQPPGIMPRGPLGTMPDGLPGMIPRGPLGTMPGGPLGRMPRAPGTPIIPSLTEDHIDKADLNAINLEAHNFQLPTKEIKTPSQIEEVWLKSQAYQDLIGFLQAMCNKIKNVKISDNYHVSPTVNNLVDVLSKLNGWIREIPPNDQSQRFGNTAYRDWFDRLTKETPALLGDALNDKFQPAIEELSVYFVDSFGNRTRIDYGTGHEMTFVAFLICLYKIGALVEDDAVAIVLRVFNDYLALVRNLQCTYRMEPAGSQGVWNLDDYQFISFIWGSAQFIGNKRLKPSSFVDRDICQSFYKDYMFFDCIRHINKVKSGPFSEHSNQLWNISAVPLWAKVNTGLIKMYKAEVLCKFPVIQHFLFGSLLSVNPVAALKSPESRGKANQEMVAELTSSQRPSQNTQATPTTTPLPMSTPTDVKPTQLENKEPNDTVSDVT